MRTPLASTRPLHRLAWGLLLTLAPAWATICATTARAQSPSASAAPRPLGTFTEVPRAQNPLRPQQEIDGVAALGDFDSDGDLDLISENGSSGPDLYYWENTGSPSAPMYRRLPDAESPLASYNSSGSYPTVGDLDGDGDLDVVVGTISGRFEYLENTGSAASPTFTEHTGTENPFDGINVGDEAQPVLADLDGDGDLDLVARNEPPFDPSETLYFENTGTAAAPAFTERTGAANPFDDIRSGGAFTLADLDGDGDLDFVSTGTYSDAQQVLGYAENTGTATSPAFVWRPRGCHALETMDGKSGTARASMMQMKATTCSPASVSGRRS